MGMLSGFRVRIGVGIACCSLILATAAPAKADTGEFSIQVSPSPLVATVKPASTNDLDLKIHNSGSSSEHLKITPRAFSIDAKTHNLRLSDDQLPDIANWVKFSSPTFSVEPGQTTSEHITLTVPADTGFSYAFALIISRQNDVQQLTGRKLRASVAVFSLLNIDRPGAVRSLEVSKFTSTQSTYEYLPAEFTIEFKNTGNTIVQPSGTVFIQRHSNDATPIDTLPVNAGGGYILPGTTRDITVDWTNGFQVNQTKTLADGTQKNELAWNWNRLSSLRFGQYTAKLVAIYDDGSRDIPLRAELTFWVIPWFMIVSVLVVIALLVTGVWSLVRGALKVSGKIHRPRKVRRF